jgi:hypothetical protein
MELASKDIETRPNKGLTKEVLERASVNDLITELKNRKLTLEQFQNIVDFLSIQTKKNDRNTDPDHKEEKASNIEKYAKAIIRSNVHGKLPKGAKINGVKITSPNGFYDHGPNADKLTSEQLKVSLIRTVIYRIQRELRNQFIDWHLVSITPSTEKNNSTLTVFFFQDKKQVDSRGYYTPAHVSIEMKTDTIKEFLQDLRNNPDLLEDFYQEAFTDIDETEENPGIRRVACNQFLLLTDYRNIPEIGPYDKKKLVTFLNTLEKFSYANGPYGTGEAITEEN